MKYYAKIKEERDGSFSVDFPYLNGCLTFGRTKAEAKNKAHEALNLWLAKMCEGDDRFKIPEPRKPRSEKNSGYYYPINVEQCVAKAVSMKQLRTASKMSRAQMARKFCMSPREYLLEYETSGYIDDIPASKRRA